MILLIVTHVVKPGLVATAERRLDANGEAMRAAPGFSFRYRAVAATDTHILTTVTGWGSETAYQDYVAARRTAERGPAFSGDSPYERTDTVLHRVARADLGALTTA